MSELIDQVVANTGLEQPVAEKAVGIILDFLSKEGPADKVQALLASLPDADALIEAARSNGGGGFMAKHMGGIMGVGSKLMSAGLDMAQVRGVIRELMAYSREKGAGDALSDVANAIPGLSQFI
jgi:hypothetical protein